MSRFVSPQGRWLLAFCAVVIAIAWTNIAHAENATFAAAVATITSAELQQHVNVLADDTFEGREAGSRGGQAAGVYLMKELQKHGLLPQGDRETFFQTFEGSSRNILGLLPGSDPELKRQVVIVGAHYDHVGYGSPRNSYGPFGTIHNGADDNASGVAGLLEILDALKQLPEAPARSILFALWDGEEKGLNGSKHWMNHPTTPLADVVFAINLDMIGRLRDQGAEVYGTRTLPGLRQRISWANQRSAIPLDFTWTMKEDSDHWSFFTRQIPVVMFHTRLHNEYHRPSDDSHLLNYSGLQEMARLTCALAYDVANDRDLAKFRAASRTESEGNRSLLEKVPAANVARLGLTWVYDAERNSCRVTAITPQSPAATAGMLPDDRIVEFNGWQVDAEPRLRLEILYAPSPVEFAVLRKDAAEPIRLTAHPAGAPIRIGLAWREDAAESGSLIITQVVPHSAAAMAGIKPRDRIYRAQGESFATAADFAKRAANAETELQLTLERDGRIWDARLELLAPRSGQ